MRQVEIEVSSCLGVIPIGYLVGNIQCFLQQVFKVKDDIGERFGILLLLSSDG